MSKIFNGKFGKSLLTLSLGGVLLASPVMLSGCQKQGPAGQNGPMWHFGEENPIYFDQTNDVGVNGDFYIDNDDMYLYKKVNGKWQQMGSLVGTGVQDIVCEYVVDADGNTILTTTHYLTNGTQRVFETCVLPTVNVGSAMTLQRAFELAPVNATIVLKADVKLAEAIELDKKITLDLNGFKILNAEDQPVEAETIITETVEGNLTVIS